MTRYRRRARPSIMEIRDIPAGRNLLRSRRGSGPNRVSYAQCSFGQDLRPESAAVKQAIEDRGMPCESPKVLTWLAESVPKHSHFTDHEFASDQVVERDTTSHQIAARICWFQGKRLLAGQRLDRLGFDERKLRIRLVASRKSARRVKVPSPSRPRLGIARTSETDTIAASADGAMKIPANVPIDIAPRLQPT
jgi:hypothetical protein